jgi:hypothetical protein
VDETFRNQFYGGSLTLYITKYFGIEGLYKQYLEDESDAGQKLEGERIEGTFFIDFSFIRPYATYFQEKEELTTTTERVENKKNGIMGGIKIFF